MAGRNQEEGPQPLDRRSLLTKALAVAGAVVLVGSHSDAFASTELIGGGSKSLNKARVDLTIDSTKSSFAVGSIAGRPAIFKGSPYGGVVNGSMLGTSIEGAIAQRDQVPQGEDYVTTTKVSGSLGTTPTDLLGTFTVDSNFLFKNGLVTGKTARKPVKVLALPHKDFDTSSAVTVGGDFGDTKFSLVAVIPVGGRGSISGMVSSKSVHLDITPLEADQLSIRLTGNYSGPTDLLALLVGAVSYFGG